MVEKRLKLRFTTGAAAAAAARTALESCQDRLMIRAVIFDFNEAIVFDSGASGE
ncbi:MAG: hypothetical protein RBR67_11330 [Desulfobacterium sp.]|nr:hypothetical protein [Desulfobacterium sp.]